jgi:hypothetical protein
MVSKNFKKKVQTESTEVGNLSHEKTQFGCGKFQETLKDMLYETYHWPIWIYRAKKLTWTEI